MARGCKEMGELINVLGSLGLASTQVSGIMAMSVYNPVFKVAGVKRGITCRVAFRCRKLSPPPESENFTFGWSRECE